MPGNPGTGKTVLAASCVQELCLAQRDAAQATPSIAYFFSKTENSRTSRWNDALRAILAPDNTVLDIFRVLMSLERREGQKTSTYEEMIDLLALLITHLGQFYLVLDGVDECEDPDGILLDLWKLRYIQGLRIVVFCRPGVGFLKRTLNAEQSIYLTPASLATDLEMYFRRNLVHLQYFRLLLPVLAIDEHIADLLSGANGMFLCARLMMSYLRSPALSSSQRLSTISNLETPERLDEMYDRIIRFFTRGPRYEQVLVRNVLLWLTFGNSPLSCSQLNDILRAEGGALYQTSSRDRSDDIKEFENAIIVTCGGLVEFRDSTCHYIHDSAWQYFRSHCSAPEACIGARAGSIEYFFPPTFDAHTELATTCLSYIIFRTPAKPLSGSIHQPAGPFHVDTLMPFLRYAALDWPRHLLDSLDNLRLVTGYAWKFFREKLCDLLQLLSQFSKNPIILMSWIEKAYTFAGVNKALILDIHTNLAVWAGKAPKLLPQFSFTNLPALAHTLADLSKDMTLLFEEWESTLSRYPNQIWADATAFTTSLFFQQSSALSLKKLTKTTSRYANFGSGPFTKISRSHQESGLCAVLTVWSSE